MAAVKLQYCDRISKDMRTSFAELLDSNRQSFRIPLGSQLDVEDESEKQYDDNSRVDIEIAKKPEPEHKEDTDIDIAKDTERRVDATIANESASSIQSLANLKQMALNITIQKAEAPAPHEKIVVVMISFWIAVISLLYFLQLSISQWKYVIGIIANINTCVFYGAPLSTIYTVLKTRDSSSIHRPTMIMNTSNAVFWAAFGVGIRDWIVIIPGSIGAVLGLIQIFLRFVIPNSSSTFAESISADVNADEFIESQ